MCSAVDRLAAHRSGRYPGKDAEGSRRTKAARATFDGDLGGAGGVDAALGAVASAALQQTDPSSPRTPGTQIEIIDEDLQKQLRRKHSERAVPTQPGVGVGVGVGGKVGGRQEWCPSQRHVAAVS